MTTFILFFLLPSLDKSLCQAQMIVRGQDLILPSESSQRHRQKRAQTHTLVQGTLHSWKQKDPGPPCSTGKALPQRTKGTLSRKGNSK